MKQSKKTILLVIIISVILVPIITSFIVSIDSFLSADIANKNQEVWITYFGGFFGSILGAGIGGYFAFVIASKQMEVDFQFRIEESKRNRNDEELHTLVFQTLSSFEKLSHEITDLFTTFYLNNYNLYRQSKQIRISFNDINTVIELYHSNSILVQRNINKFVNTNTLIISKYEYEVKDVNVRKISEKFMVISTKWNKIATMENNHLNPNDYFEKYIGEFNLIVIPLVNELRKLLTEYDIRYVEHFFGDTFPNFNYEVIEFKAIKDEKIEYHE